MKSYKFVNFLWDDAKAAALDPVGRLVYRSNILGSDQRITNTGGGNTSSKISEKDPLTGQPTEVLWVKGSGGDLRTSTRENFSSLYQQKLLDMQQLYAARPDKGLKAPAEDDMVGMQAHATFNLNPRASSIDTPLHSFLPAKFVDHMHPNAIISIAASKNCEKLTQEIFGGEMAYVPWMRPGFELGLAMQAIVQKNQKVKSIMMGQHGFISWDNEEPATRTRSIASRKPPPSSKRNTKPKAATPRPSAALNTPRSRPSSVARPSPRSSRGSAAKFPRPSASSAPCRTTKKSSAS